MSVANILEERASQHGDYKTIVDARASILTILAEVYIKRHESSPPTNLIIMWGDIILKLVRSAANPSHKDNWDDLEGYARIINEYMEVELYEGT